MRQLLINLQYQLVVQEVEEEDLGSILALSDVNVHYRSNTICVGSMYSSNLCQFQHRSDYMAKHIIDCPIDSNQTRVGCGLPLVLVDNFLLNYTTLRFSFISIESVIRLLIIFELFA